MSYSTCDFSCVSMNCFHFADVAELGEIGFRGGDFVSAESFADKSGVNKLSIPTMSLFQMSWWGSLEAK